MSKTFDDWWDENSDGFFAADRDVAQYAWNSAREQAPLASLSPEPGATVRALAHRNRDRDGYEPSAEEIAAATAEIRAGLTPEQLSKRLVGVVPQEAVTREYGVSLVGSALVFSEK